MKKSTGLGINYRKNWDTSEGSFWWPVLREFIQGALDEQKINPDHTFSIDYTTDTGKLRIGTHGVTLPLSVWLMGVSSKMDDERTIGGYGEGLKIATLVAVRNGVSLLFRNGKNETWVPTLEPDDDIPSELVLKILSEPAENLRDEFIIEIDKIPLDAFVTFRDRILDVWFLEPNITTPLGKILTKPERKGQIFIKGVYVHQDKNLAHGYNFTELKCDPDRKMTDHFDMSYAIAQMWQSAALADKTHLPTVFKMLSDNAPDLVVLPYCKVTQLAIALSTPFITAHNGAVPVTTDYDHKRAVTAGIPSVIVPKVLAEVLGDSVNTLTSALAAHHNGAVLCDDLDENEQEVLNHAAEIVDSLVHTSPDLVGLNAEFKIVEFSDVAKDFALAKLDKPGLISRKCFASLACALVTIVIVNMPVCKGIPGWGEHQRYQFVMQLLIEHMPQWQRYLDDMEE
jgi:hypothetical protein